jgi:hypothetical protein
MVHAERGQPGPVVWHDGGTGGFRSVAGFVAESGTSVVGRAFVLGSVGHANRPRDPEVTWNVKMSSVDRVTPRSSY